MIKELFNSAVQNLQKHSNKGKGYEFFVLWSILHRMKSAGFSVSANTLHPGVLKFAGGPSSANKSIFSYFSISKNGEPDQEAWISVEVQGLSSTLSAKSPVSNLPASYHEIDVGIFQVLTSEHPSYKELNFAATCKHTKFHKAYLREALGLRRETAYYCSHSVSSSAAWFVSPVPADPPVPLILYSSDTRCKDYEKPVDCLGVYVSWLPVPIK